jgi:hypothetical protein
MTVTITSTFYDTSAGVPASLVTETDWALSHPQIGSSYGVDGIADFKVTAHPSTPLTVNVAAGTAWGHGVLDISDATVSVTCTAPAAGTSRYDLICIRRDWTPAVGGPTTITKVEGGSTKAIPAGREHDPGTLDDQPLALVLWTAGQTQPTQIIDLRCWQGDGGVLALDALARDYLDRVGTKVNIGGVVWQRTIGSGDLAVWTKMAEVGSVELYGFGGALDFTPAAGQTAFKIQGGTAVNTTDNSGYARITFPRPFPNGLLTCLLMDGDSSVDRAISRAMIFSAAGSPWNTGRKADIVYAVAYSNGNGNYQAVQNQVHRVDWVAIGW